jgi:SAM-dependent methyltransferase
MESKNEKRFTDKAGIYQQYRASYPKELIEYLYTAGGLKKNSVIADIGSGTGIFSRLLLERGNHVFCVEPNDNMRLVAERELRNVVGFNSVNASAENTGLKEKSVNFITTAQAFHWFDRQKFRLECRRILKDGGKVVLIWNIRDYEHDIVKKDFAIRKKYSVGDAKGLSSDKKSLNEYAGFFLNDECEGLTFANDLILERDDYIGMNLSRSYAPTKDKDPEKYSGLFAELSDLFDEYSNNGVLIYPHTTKCYIGGV